MDSRRISTIRQAVRKALLPAITGLAVRLPNTLTLSLLRRFAHIQLSVAQIGTVAKAVRDRPRCRFLVFGLGRDSAFWHGLNRGGHTVFVEDDAEWFEQVKGMHPFLEALKVSYSTKVPEWTALDPEVLPSPAGLPEDFPGSRWDVVLVDAPAGWDPACPGRMQSICLAKKLCDQDGVIFVHDTDRPAEAGWSDRVLGTSFDELRAMHTGWLRGYQR